MEKYDGDNSGFWRSLSALVGENKIVIDRPRGTAHPRFPDFIFPVDYGFLEGTQAMDGGGIDVWKGQAGGDEINGIFCTIDGLKKDTEIKIVIGCNQEEIDSIQKLYNVSKSLKGIFIKIP